MLDLLGLEYYLSYLISQIGYENEQNNKTSYALMALYAISSQKAMSKTYQELTDTSSQDERTGDEIVEDVTADFNSILKKGG